MADGITRVDRKTASVPQQEQRSRSSVHDAKVTFRNELTACLTLTAPVGMNEEARRDWFAVAWDTLKHIPPEVLAIGAHAARQKCDHPSKIVPTIIAETKEMMRWRYESDRARYEQRQIAPPEPEYCSPEDAKRILAEAGLRPDWNAIADTHPKDGDVEQAPLVSGGGSEGNRT